MSNSRSSSPVWTITEEPVAEPDSQTLLGAYFAEVAEAINAAESSLASPCDDLAPPAGAFLLARLAGEPMGCVGLRLLDTGDVELKRMYVAPAARGLGLGERLLDAVEPVARKLGGTRIVLDTRAELAAARRLYERYGYAEVPPYNDNEHADRWYAKPLA